MAKIGIIGGSGLYKIDGVKITESVKMDTPFGHPSDEVILGELHGREIVFLPRHGKAHTTNPTKVNYRANIFALKELGVEWLVSLSACGSLKEKIAPLDFVIPLQFVDRTNQARDYTFFDEGITAHIPFAHPVCVNLAKKAHEATKKAGVGVHFGGTYVNMEGPQFSTLAESNLYRSWGMDIIGMTNMTEARLAREAEMCYVTVAAVTDYDCWRDASEDVNIDMVIDNLNKNVSNAKKVLKEIILSIDDSRDCACRDALKYAIVTRSRDIDRKIKEKLKPIIGKYVK